MENWIFLLAISLATTVIFLSMHDVTNKNYVVKLPENSNNSKIRTEIQATVDEYNATAEIERRRENMKKWCKANKKQKVLNFESHLFRISSLTKYISKFGVSTGKQAFWACFTPKCASQSFTAALLHATGYIKHGEPFNGSVIGIGRNHCPDDNWKCLKRNLSESIEPNSGVVSARFSSLLRLQESVFVLRFFSFEPTKRDSILK